MTTLICENCSIVNYAEEVFTGCCGDMSRNHNYVYPIIGAIVRIHKTALWDASTDSPGVRYKPKLVDGDFIICTTEDI